MMGWRNLAYALAVLASTAFAAEVDITVRDGKGLWCVPSSVVALQVSPTRTAEGVESYVCRLTSQVETQVLVRLEARLPVAASRMTLFDGRRELPLTSVRTNAFLIEAFPMAGVWGTDRKGAALALGAEAGDSYVDFISTPQALVISVRAALLKKGGVYETVFHRFPFDAKYGAMDAFASYYALYPRRFTRNPEVDPQLNGINAQYASWRRADPETCRFMNASWECCIGASRTWGDVNDCEQPVGPRNTAYSWDEEIGYNNRKGKYRRLKNGEITQAKFDEVLAERLGFGYFCGVRNAYYVMALANISNEIAKRHPDSIAVGKTFADSSYLYSTEVFTFPECSWGQDIRRQLKKLSETADVSAVYFDVSRPRGIYRGTRLADMRNVSWDAFGPGVARGVGSAKLFDYVRTLSAKKSRYRLGVTINTKYAHLSDIFYADTSDSECCPWDHEKPFPLERRLAAGEKGYQLWEGFSTREFDPNFKQWPENEKNMLLNALSRFAVHASYRTGASLPAGYLSEYTALMSHAFVRMNQAGWKPVPGAQVAGKDWELARYGLGANSYLAVNNLTNVARRAAVTVFPDEIASGRVGGTSQRNGWLYVPFYGGMAEVALKGAEEFVSLTVGPQLAGVLEAVGSLAGEGTLTAAYAGDFETVRVRLVSRTFRGDVHLRDDLESYRREGAAARTLSPGETLEVVYRNVVLQGVLQAVRALKGDEAIRHGGDDDSRELAARIAFFFQKASGVRPAVVVEKDLGDRALAFGNVVVRSNDRWELSQLVTRVLNLLNRERYPAYRPPTPMPEDDRRYFTFLRL